MKNMTSNGIKKRGTIDSYNLICFLIAVFPILPYWFKIAGVNVAYVICLIDCVLVFLLSGAKISLYSNVAMAFIAQGVVIRIIQLLLAWNVKTLVFYVVTTIALLIAMLEVVNNRNRFVGVINTLVYASGFVSFWGLVEEVTHFNIFSLLNTRGAVLNYNSLRFGLLRIISFSSHAIAYCLYLTMMLCLIFYSFQFCKNRKERIMKRVIYIMVLANAVLTLSRSSLLVLIASQLVLLYCASGLKKFIIAAIKLTVVAGIAIAVLSMINSKVLNAVQMVFYMLLAVFNDNYSNSISAAFGNDNLSGIGNRLDLYSWVWQELKGYRIFGKGYGAEFSHRFTFMSGIYTAEDVKTSIEVQYLSTLYYFGIFGMISQLIAYIGTILLCLKDKMAKAYWEEKVSFSFVAIVALIACYIEFFAVSQGTDRELYILIVDLLIVYKANKKFERRA